MGDWALPEEKPVLLARVVPSISNSIGAGLRLLWEEYTGPWSLEDMSLHRAPKQTKQNNHRNHILNIFLRLWITKITLFFDQKSGKSHSFFAQKSIKLQFFPIKNHICKLFVYFSVCCLFTFQSAVCLLFNQLFVYFSVSCLFISSIVCLLFCQLFVYFPQLLRVALNFHRSFVTI